MEKRAIAGSIGELVGHTPLLRLHRIEAHFGVTADLLAKLEYFNPAGSVKDRVAKKMIEIILDELPTNGPVRDKLNGYLEAYKNNENIDQSEVASDILKQIDSKYLGKGLFAQLLLEKINMTNDFIVPDYIKAAVKFVLKVEEKDGK